MTDGPEGRKGEGMIEQCREKFVELYGGEGEIRSYFSPGRVNLIGEHTDYNGGHVFPCALTVGTYGVARRREDRRVRLYSMNFDCDGVIEVSLDDLAPGRDARWGRYVEAVIWTFAQKGMAVECGFDFLCCGTIPNSSGLSSSASLEVLACTVLKDLYGFTVDQVDVALYSQYAENEYVGVNCGIMDQFAIALGKKDHAIFLDTATLEYAYCPVVLEGAKIVIGNTNKKRGLGDSKYNERRAECEEALRRLQKVASIPSLGALTTEEFEEIEEAIGDPVLARRARHAVTENERTLRAVEALNRQDLAQFGQLMNSSHISLRDDYEVTGEELDAWVEAAWKQSGVIGARMTGAGFGGCAVSIVEEEAVERFTRNVGAAYREKIGYDCTFYVVEIGDGPRRLD